MSTFSSNTAKTLGENKTIMDSYWAYHEREQNWFFSPNPYLDDAERKPNSFLSFDSWKKLTSNEKKKEWAKFRRTNI
ncbi:MAG: hypothetical protein JKY08_10715 [Flavobacteriaceae bacterium]|nr:hypothetical protein [Flavobacteriaceae bacterium]